MQTNVFITVDTEVWPKSEDWRRTILDVEMKRDIYGETIRGEYGLRYQLKVLQQFRLRATFFVESLFATVVGLSRLMEIVTLIRSYEQDVQLHVHPEWLRWMDEPLVKGKQSQFLKDFSKDQQSVMIGAALQNLRNCGADGVRAFRAGNYGANRDTLKALRGHNLTFDTSYNFPYLSHQCGILVPDRLLEPCEIDGIQEYPVTFFEDWPGHQRHLQITACSTAELNHILSEAHRLRRRNIVLVSHSFELLKNRQHATKPLLPDRTCVDRFERLCAFLDENRDRFMTAAFGDIHELEPSGRDRDAANLTSSVWRTGARYVEQALRRLA